MSHIALFANPDSGSGEAGSVVGLLEARGARVTSFSLDELERADVAGAHRLAVAGGDGSVGAVAELARRSRLPLAVIPSGTANDFARSLDLPDDAEEAADLAVHGRVTRPLDLGHAGDGPFVNAASAGLSPMAARDAHGLKGALGPLAYAVGAVRAGLRSEPVHCRVVCDGEEAFAGRAWQVIVALTGAFGGGAEVEADPADGRLDVVVVEAGSRARLVLHAYGMRAGDLDSQKGVVRCGGRRVELETERGGFNVDGEIIDRERLELSVEPRAFQVVVA